MKKLLLIAFAVVFGATTMNAQEQGDIRVGVKGVYGTEVGVDGGGMGVNVGAEYLVTDVISVAPSYTMFFESEEDILGSTFTSQVTAINIDGRYYFLTDDLQVYGMAGISLLTVKVDFGFGELEANETGINVGGGVIKPLSDNFNIEGQVKYQTETDQIVIGAGVSLSF